MKRQVIAAAAIAVGLAATPAMAQDKSGKDWTGSYMGVNAGYAWSEFKANDPTEFDGGGAIFNYGSFDFNGKGGIAGFQSGYNWQIGSWVIGYESDWQFKGNDGSKTFTASIFDFPGGPFNTVGASEIESFGTVRARFGYLLSPSTLIFATGGLAYGEVRTTLDFPLVNGTPTGFTDSDRQTHFGYSVGGGLEFKLAQGISLKAEYLYLNLGDEKHSFQIAGDTYTWNERVDMHTVRVGINVQYHGLLDMVLGSK